MRRGDGKGVNIRVFGKDDKPKINLQLCRLMLVLGFVI